MEALVTLYNKIRSVIGAACLMNTLSSTGTVLDGRISETDDRGGKIATRIFPWYSTYNFEDATQEPRHSPAMHQPRLIALH